MERPTLSSLFAAAVEASQRAYGQRPRGIYIITQNGQKYRMDIPPDWTPEEIDQVIRCSADCFAETFMTLLETGHRLTRAALLVEMKKKNRERAESTVCTALEDMQRLGVIDNRSDVSPRGYGLPGWVD